MKLSFSTFELRRKYPFMISGHRMEESTVVFVQLEHDGIIGYGEASPGYYFDENPATVMSFLSSLDLTQFKDPGDIVAILGYVDQKESGNTAAKASVDIALHDLAGKLAGKPCYSFFNADPAAMPATSLTIGMDTPEMVRKKVNEAGDFKIIKVKLGGEDDKAIVNAVRDVTDVPLTIDANQGWTDRQEALDMIHWLNERNTIFIEQPMPRDEWDGNAWLTANSPLPVVADEAMQRLSDIEKMPGVYHGINIKMVKCTGMHEGSLIIKRARELGLKIMIGCMGESSVAIMGAAALAPLCDWVDLDSTWLINNNPFKNPGLKDGCIVLPDAPGIGVEKITA